MSEEGIIFKFKELDPELQIIDAKDYDIPKLNLENVEGNFVNPIYSKVLELQIEDLDDFYDIFRTIDDESGKGFLFVFKKSVSFGFEHHLGVELGSVLLSNCVFEENLDIKKQQYISAYFFYCCFFKKGLSILGGILTSGLTFTTSQFSSLSISDSLINQFFTFRKCEFIGVAKIKDNKLDTDLKILSCTFHNLFTLRHNLSEKQNALEIGFGTFKSFLDVNNTNFEILEPVFFNTKFEINSAVVQKGYNGFRIRKSANKLKKYFRRIGDLIEANKFSNIELEASRIDPLMSISWWDKQILFWNYWSNNHGISPGYALCFIGYATLFFSLLLCIPIAGKLHWDGIDGIGPTVNHFFNVLMITNWKYEPYGIPSYWNLPILFIGRVFIGYGIYQFIAAFRKYAKN